MDPSFPSVPPPPDDDSVRPMSYFAAGVWIAGIHLGFLWMALMLIQLREATTRDVVAQIACQVLAYTAGLFLLLRAYGPNSRIRDFVAMRLSNWVFGPLALLAGMATALPANWLLAQIEAHWPVADKTYDFAHLYFASSPFEKVLIGIGIVAVGPLVEELIFRGALFVPLRQKNPPAGVIVATSLLFALVHQEPRTVGPIFLVGLILGFLRWRTGSLLPPLLFHAAFNAIPLIDLIGMKDAESPGMNVPNSAIALATIVAAGLLVGIWRGTEHSRRAKGARTDDL